MKTEPILTNQQHLALTEAIKSAVIIDQQLIKLLDLFDFYIERFPISSKSEKMELADVTSSIKALGVLPNSLALSLMAWRAGVKPLLSASGLNENILTEIELHMMSLETFFKRKKLCLSQYNHEALKQAIKTLQNTNEMFQ